MNARILFACLLAVFLFAASFVHAEADWSNPLVWMPPGKNYRDILKATLLSPPEENPEAGIFQAEFVIIESLKGTPRDRITLQIPPQLAERFIIQPLVYEAVDFTPSSQFYLLCTGESNTLHVTEIINLSDWVEWNMRARRFTTLKGFMTALENVVLPVLETHAKLLRNAKMLTDDEYLTQRWHDALICYTWFGYELPDLDQTLYHGRMIPPDIPRIPIGRVLETLAAAEVLQRQLENEEIHLPEYLDAMAPLLHILRSPLDMDDPALPAHRPEERTPFDEFFCF